MSSPNASFPARDLTDAEFNELDELLAATPEPLDPFDAVMLDGFLCGVLVQPVLIEPEAWLPHVFDLEGEPLPDAADAAWLERTRALILRRHGALNRAIVEDGWFDPMVVDVDEKHPAGPGGDDAPEWLNKLGPISQALMPWVAGFQHAIVCFPDLAELPVDALMHALARVYRHLPAETDAEREIVETIDREQPLTTLDAAIEDLVSAVVEMSDLTRDARYKVDTVRRDAPKIGRNEPCPCGSGKKYKHCHGAL